jgi:hypothetical protein
MKRLLFLCLFCPYLTNGQSLGSDEFSIQRLLPHVLLSGMNSLFHPDLHVSPDAVRNLKVLLCTGNRHSMKEMSYLDAGIAWNFEHGTIGYKGQFQGIGSLSSMNHQAHYTQTISSSLLAGISIGFRKMKFNEQKSVNNGCVRFKIRKSFGEKTSFGFGVGASGNPIDGDYRITKEWSCRWDQVLNPFLSMGAAVEKVDGADPRLRFFIQGNIRQKFSMAGGWELENGNIEVAGLHHNNSMAKGLIMRHHPLLGYGMELFLQYAIH